MRTKLTALLALLLALGTAAAISVVPLEAESRLLVTTPDGATVVARGEVEVDADGARLELELAGGYSGFAVVLVEDAAGVVTTVDAMILEDGSLVLLDGTDFVPLADLAAAAGLAVEIEIERDGDELEIEIEIEDDADDDDDDEDDEDDEDEDDDADDEDDDADDDEDDHDDED